MKINNSHGLSIIETLISLSMLVGVALISAYILNNTNVIKKKLDTKATIDQIHVLQVQRARSTDAVRLAVSSTNTGLTAGQLKCFDGSKSGFGGTDVGGCDSKGTSGLPQLADWSDSEPLSGPFVDTDFSMFGENQLFETVAQWKATCPNGDRCNSIEVKLTTQVKVGSSLAPSAPERKLDPRITILNFNAQYFADQIPVRFVCTGALAVGGVIATSINNAKNLATCTAFALAAESQCASNDPLANFGDIITDGPVSVCYTQTAVNCLGGSDRGYRRINFAQKECRNR